MHPLTQLACGDIGHGYIGEITRHLANTLDLLLTRSKKLRDQGADDDLSIFGPFLGRATLEVALTAIMARFDPYRILAIRKSQLSTSYDPDVRNPMAFNWSADVQGVDKSKEWDKRPGLNDLQRALLCRHFNDLYWEEALALMLDDVPFHRGNTWMRKLKRVDPDGFWNYMRATADKIYSELSKGIHHEFVIPIAVKFDRITVEDLLGRTWELIGALGMATCYSPAVKPLENNSAIDLFEEAQEELVK